MPRAWNFQEVVSWYGVITIAADGSAAIADPPHDPINGDPAVAAGGAGGADRAGVAEQPRTRAARARWPANRWRARSRENQRGAGRIWRRGAGAGRPGSRKQRRGRFRAPGEDQRIPRKRRLR